MKKNRILLLLSVLLLSSCGTKVNKLGAFGLDHSANWNDNYYTYFDKSLLEFKNSIIPLEQDTNKVFTSYTDPNFVSLEDRATGEDALSYYADFDEVKGYGPNMKLSKSNNYIREGFVSKLFDGQLFCHGYYEAARVQIKEDGFSFDLGKSLASSDYLYLNFKSALNFKGNKIEPHLDDITLYISFYGKDGGVTYSYELKDVPTNQGETYIFYGFFTKDLNLNEATSIAITYDLDRESFNIEKGTSIEHALLLYEFGFKNPVFK